MGTVPRRREAPDARGGRVSRVDSWSRNHAPAPPPESCPNAGGFTGPSLLGCEDNLALPLVNPLAKIDLFLLPPRPLGLLGALLQNHGEIGKTKKGKTRVCLPLPLASLVT